MSHPVPLARSRLGRQLYGTQSRQSTVGLGQDSFGFFSRTCFEVRKLYENLTILREFKRLLINLDV